MSHIFSPYNISAHHHREHVRSNNISFVLMPGYSNPNDERKMEINPVAFRRKIFIYVYYYFFFFLIKRKKISADNVFGSLFVTAHVPHTISW